MRCLPVDCQLVRWRFLRRARRPAGVLMPSGSFSRDQDQPAIPLGREEVILWVGRPGQRWFDRRDTLLAAVCALWMAFVVLWLVTLPDGAPLLRAVGIAFLFFGAHLVIGRYLLRRVQLRHRLYVLTTERALVAHDSRVVSSMTLPRHPIAVVDAVGCDVANVYLGRPTTMLRLWDGTGVPLLLPGRA